MFQHTPSLRLVGRESGQPAQTEGLKLSCAAPAGKTCENHPQYKPQVKSHTLPDRNNMQWTITSAGENVHQWGLCWYHPPVAPPDGGATPTSWAARGPSW